MQEFDNDVGHLEIHPSELEQIFCESDKQTPIQIVVIPESAVADYVPSVDHHDDDPIVSAGFYWQFTSKNGQELFCPVGGDGSMFEFAGSRDSDEHGD